MKNGKYDAIVGIKEKMGRNPAEIMGNLKKVAGVTALYEVTGDVDYLLVVCADSNNELKKIVDEIKNIDGIERFRTYNVLGSWEKI